MSLLQDTYAEMQAICQRAWEKNLLPGFSGNISLRVSGSMPINDHVLQSSLNDIVYETDVCIAITRSGVVKGDLQIEDLCLLDVQGELVHSFGRTLPSSEASMHVQIYAVRPDVGAVIHVHPRHLLALEMRVAQRDFLDIPIFEAEIVRKKLSFVMAHAPGSAELAAAVATACTQGADAVWMAQHGLTCVGKTASEALALVEELDHLAAVQLLSM